MGWMNALTETYDNYFNGAELSDDPHPLVPVGFTERKVGLIVRIKRDAVFHSAELLKTEEQRSMPSDPAAESRTGQKLPYPICDELRYTAGDLSQLSNEDYGAYFDVYLNNLESWCAEDGSVEELIILRDYLRKRTLAADIIAYGAVKADKNGFIPSKLINTSVDFYIYRDAEFVSICELQSVRLSWQKRLIGRMSDTGLCYSSGSVEPILSNHAKLEGNAKLISSKDGPRPFQFKGRFTDASQACAIGYSTSAKAHNTIKWLRSRQGYNRYGTTFITWSTDCRKVIPPQNPFDQNEEIVVTDTEEIYGNKLRASLSGRMKPPESKKNPKIVMLGMESATPGRMSMIFYEEFDDAAYLESLSKWYERCIWRLPVKKGDDPIKYYITSPNIRELSEAVFGQDNIRRADNDRPPSKSITKQVSRFYQDILVCIANARIFPEIYVNAACHRACCPSGFTDSKGKWHRDNWLKCVAVTLAMLKSSHNKEGYKVALNKEEKCRDYIFGRLLAVADMVEITASRGTDAQFRQTNAVRYFGAMQQRPATTWMNIREKLEPYFGKIDYKKDCDRFRSLIDEITHLADDGALSDNSPLSPRFLEGYHNQRYELSVK